MRIAPLVIALPLLLLGTAGCASGGDGEPRDILLFSIDTLRADVLGSYGSEYNA